MTRPAPPPLEFPYPPCSICGEDVHLDDSWYCPSCGVRWDTDGAHLYDGEWEEPKAEQCTSVLRPWEHNEAYPDLRTTEYRCVLDERHLTSGRGADIHVHPEWFGGWSSKDEHVYEVDE